MLLSPYLNFINLFNLNLKIKRYYAHLIKTNKQIRYFIFNEQQF